MSRPRPPPARVRLAALDLDGTLLGDDQQIRPGVRRAIDAALDAGVTVILSTGRSDPSAREFHESLGLRGPLISYQGAVVAAPDGTRWYDKPVSPSSVPAAAAFADARGDELTIYHGDRVYFRHAFQDDRFYSAWFGLPRVQVEHWDAVPGAPTKLLVITATADACDEVRGAWSDRFAQDFEIMRSHPLFVEAMAPGVSKGRAVSYLAERMGVPRADVLCVGDNENDISMIEWAGIGVAIGGAPAPVLAAADAVAPPLHQEGAAWALRRYALGLDR